MDCDALTIKSQKTKEMKSHIQSISGVEDGSNQTKLFVPRCPRRSSPSASDPDLRDAEKEVPIITPIYLRVLQLAAAAGCLVSALTGVAWAEPQPPPSSFTDDPAGNRPASDGHAADSNADGAAS